jgi:sulfite reductase (ferredoxin)
LFKKNNRLERNCVIQDGKIDDERFRSLRLARGVYGQRQECK